MAFQDPSFLLDSLYCNEPTWEEQEDAEEEEEEEEEVEASVVVLENDLLWEDEELNRLLLKEEKQQEELLNLGNVDSDSSDPSLSLARREAVEWILGVNAHYGFSALTSTLAINYLDRFLRSFKFQKEKPWMTQLVAVTCLSLAAKVEETHVPLLLDLQISHSTDLVLKVGDARYVFEAKTIQRMELLVLSSLKWKMHPVTPLSFLDHIVRRLGLKTHLHWQFLKRCEHLLLSALSDSRFVGCLPSVVATATMLHAIDHIEHSDAKEYKKQLLCVLKITKEKAEECYRAMAEVWNTNNHYKHNMWKRKHEESIPESPSGVIDGAFRSESDSSNDWWRVGPSSLSSCSSPAPPLFKKIKTQQQQRMNLSSPINRVVVAVVGSSP